MFFNPVKNCRFFSKLAKKYNPSIEIKTNRLGDTPSGELKRWNNSNNNRHGGSGWATLEGRPEIIIGGIFGIGIIGIGLYYTYNLETVPFSGRKRFVSLSKESEQRLGTQGFMQLHRQYANRMLPPTNPDVKVINEVVANLLKANNLTSKHQWEVFVVQSDEVNAFVLPNGKIFVFTGILPIMKSKDGIAVVLGHEIAHVLYRHTAEKLSWTSLLGYIHLGLSLAGLEPPRFLTSLIFNYGLLLPNSRLCETEADQAGLELMSRACYNPKEAPELWKRMASMKGSNSRNWSEWASTHPSHEHRITDLESWMGKAMTTRNLSNCSDFNNFSQYVNYRHF